MWVILSILTLLIIFAVIFAIAYSKGKKTSKKQEPDYYTFFIMGIIWLGAGIPLATTSNNWALAAMGIVFMIIGLVNKDKWKNHKRPCWKDLSKKEKRIKIWAIILLAIAVFVLAFYVLFRANVL